MMDGDPIITADDVIRGGACRDGVMRVVSRFPSKIAAAMPVSQVLKLVPKGDENYVLKAAEQDGDGNGYGNGNGYGDGYGNGYGNGNGYGDGYGNGYGDGNGNGNGYGYGNGYGNGYGYGDGYGGSEDED